MYIENLNWVTEAKRLGYSFLDAGLGKYSELGTCYGMESDVIFNDK